MDRGPFSRNCSTVILLGTGFEFFRTPPARIMPVDTLLLTSFEDASLAPRLVDASPPRLGAA